MGVKTDTRERMVRSAALLLRENGVGGTSIAAVLEHSRGPRGSVAYHFPGGRAEILTEALRRVGGLVTASLRGSAGRGDSPEKVFGAVCDYYRKQLTETGFAAGCPIGAAAQEAYDDPALGPVVAGVVGDWKDALAEVLRKAGHDSDEAGSLAMLCISALEGAIMMSRVTRSTAPIDTVHARVIPLLTVNP